MKKTYRRVIRRCVRSKFSDRKFSVRTVEGNERSSCDNRNQMKCYESFNVNLTDKYLIISLGPI